MARKVSLSRQKFGPVGYSETPDEVITPQGKTQTPQGVRNFQRRRRETESAPGYESPGRSWSLPDQSLNLVEKIQWDAMKQRLARDKEVQASWKRYQELTKGGEQWDYDSWLFLNYGKGNLGGQRLSQYTGRF
ncbi:MAG: hypothetical protein PHI12_12535 [Dehalococcoidales bacterium]|nr:hypothetical protein [Dehalococcoidales bacterium]